MTAAKQHPGVDVLSDYALGRLLDGELQTVAEHLEQCDDCQETLSHLQLPDDTMVRDLAGDAPAEPYGDEPEFAAALAAIRRASFARGELTEDHPPSSTAAALGEAPPAALRDYELLAPLGQGGMGMVYRARHTRLDRMVALKVLPAERMRLPEAVARFHREMKAIGNLDHPHIVRAFDAGEVDGKHFLVMELIDGVDLATLAEREGRLRVADACELVRQAAVGLDYAHRNGLVHRDVKPSNLMLDRSGVVKVLDLGLARMLGEGDSQAAANSLAASQSQLPASGASVALPARASELTGADQAMGTPDYMAPEQCTDIRRVDARSDVWSLGATLYRLLAGQPPYSGLRYDTLAKKIAGLTKDPAPPISARRRDLPAELVALLDRLLAKQQADRPATPGDVAAALAPFCVGHEVRRLAGITDDAASEPGAQAGNRRRWRRWTLVAAAIGVVIAWGAILARIMTPYGELVVDVPRDARNDVQVAVKRDGEIHVMDATHGWEIALVDGRWDIELSDPDDEFTLDATSVEITRGRKRLVHVLLARPDPPQTGMWRMTLPAGFVRDAPLESLGEGEYLLRSGGNLGGRYRWDGRQLVVVVPDDPRYEGLAWRWDGDELVLVEEPPSHPSGARYLGARLAFVSATLPQANTIVGGGPRYHLGETDATRLADLLVRDPKTGSYYERIATPMSWHDAKEFCQQRGGHLATVGSAEENEFLYQRFGRDQACWLGGTDEATEGVWHWVTGEQMAYTNWFRNEPSNSGEGEHFMAFGNRISARGGTINFHYDGYWNDLSNNGEQAGKAFVLPLCEWEPDRVPAEIVRRADGTPAARRSAFKFEPGAAELVEQNGVEQVHEADGASWRFSASGTRTFRLVEITNPDVQECIATYRAAMRTQEIVGKAYLEMSCRLPGRDELVSRGLHRAVSGTSSWANYETPILLEQGQRPDLIRLNLVIEGGGVAWLRHVELTTSPLPFAAPPR